MPMEKESTTKVDKRGTVTTDKEYGGTLNEMMLQKMTDELECRIETKPNPERTYQNIYAWCDKGIYFKTFLKLTCANVKFVSRDAHFNRLLKEKKSWLPKFEDLMGFLVRIKGKQYLDLIATTIVETVNAAYYEKILNHFIRHDVVSTAGGDINLLMRDAKGFVWLLLKARMRVEPYKPEFSRYFTRVVHPVLREFNHAIDANRRGVLLENFILDFLGRPGVAEISAAQNNINRLCAPPLGGMGKTEYSLTENGYDEQRKRFWPNEKDPALLQYQEQKKMPESVMDFFSKIYECLESVHGSQPKMQQDSKIKEEKETLFLSMTGSLLFLRFFPLLITSHEYYSQLGDLAFGDFTRTIMKPLVDWASSIGQTTKVHIPHEEEMVLFLKSLTARRAIKKIQYGNSKKVVEINLDNNNNNNASKKNAELILDAEEEKFVEFIFNLQEKKISMSSWEVPKIFGEFKEAIPSHLREIEEIESRYKTEKKSGKVENQTQVLFKIIRMNNAKSVEHFFKYMESLKDAGCSGNYLTVDFTQTNEKGLTLIEFAIEENAPSYLMKPLVEGSSMYHSKLPLSILEKAVTFRSFFAIEYLCKAFPDFVRMTDDSGNNILHLMGLKGAQTDKDQEIWNLLISLGADAVVKNYAGKTAIELNPAFTVNSVKSPLFQLPGKAVSLISSVKKVKKDKKNAGSNTEDSPFEKSSSARHRSFYLNVSTSRSTENTIFVDYSSPSASTVSTPPVTSPMTSGYGQSEPLPLQKIPAIPIDNTTGQVKPLPPLPQSRQSVVARLSEAQTSPSEKEDFLRSKREIRGSSSEHEKHVPKDKKEKKNKKEDKKGDKKEKKNKKAETPSKRDSEDFSISLLNDPSAPPEGLPDSVTLYSEQTDDKSVVTGKMPEVSPATVKILEAPVILAASPHGLFVPDPKKKTEIPTIQLSIKDLTDSRKDADSRRSSATDEPSGRRRSFAVTKQ